MLGLFCVGLYWLGYIFRFYLERMWFCVVRIRVFFFIFRRWGVSFFSRGFSGLFLGSLCCCFGRINLFKKGVGRNDFRAFFIFEIVEKM